MAEIIAAQSEDLFDRATGRWVGKRDLQGREQIAAPATGDIRARRVKYREDTARAAVNQMRLWSSGMTVQPFEPVRLSTGVVLIATQAAVGTTGASEPTVTAGAAPAAITDNTVTWWPKQELSRPAPAGFPAVTVVESSGASTRTLYNIFNNPTLFEQASAPNVHTSGGSGNTTQSMGWTVNDGGTSNTGPGAGRVSKFRTVAFMIPDEVFDIGYLSASTTYENERLLIEITDPVLGTYMVTEAPILPGGNGTSRKQTVTIPGGRRDRIIRLRCFGGFILQYIGVAADTNLRRPPVRGLTAMMNWDSYLDTELPAVKEANFDLGPNLARRLGFPNCIANGSGGTSYGFDDNSGSGRKSLKTVMQTNNFGIFAPDVRIYGLGFNAAVNGVAPAVEAADAQFCWSTADAFAPSAPDLIIGPHYARPGFTTQVAAMRDALKTQFLAWGKRNSAFIDPLDGSITLGDGTVVRAGDTAWLNTTNASWAIPPSGGGFDGAHLSIAGKAFYEDCLVSACDAALNALGY